MKLVWMALIASIGCASINYMNVAKKTTLTYSEINDTYKYAKQLFISYTHCSVPLNIAVTVEDITLKDLNYQRISFYYTNDGRIEVGIIEGDFDKSSNTIRIAMEYPDRQRVLFHEFLHLLIHKSPNCFALSNNISLEHAAIKTMVNEFVQQTGRKQISDKWIYDAIKRM